MIPRHSFYGTAKMLFLGAGRIAATIVNSILLFVVYFTAVAITSLVAKAFGKRFLNTEIDRKRETYWSNIDTKKSPLEAYYRQF